MSHLALSKCSQNLLIKIVKMSSRNAQRRFTFNEGRQYTWGYSYEKLEIRVKIEVGKWKL